MNKPAIRSPLRCVLSSLLLLVAPRAHAQVGSGVAADPATSRPPAETSPATEASSTESSPEAQAALQHGEALAAELDGNLTQALDLVRKAHALAPDDETIAFDLARLAYESKSPKLDADVADFLALPASTPDSSLLRAYLWLRKQDKIRAKEEVDRVLALRPGDAEATRLRAVIEPPAPAGKPLPPFVARLRLSAQADTNVSVLPDDDPTRLSAQRLLVDGQVRAQGKSNQTRWQAGASVNGGPYLQRRPRLEPYESIALTGFAGMSQHRPTWIFNADVALTEIMVKQFAAEFVRQADAQAELRARLSGLQVGGYVSTALRDFVRGNHEAEKEDRDGPKLEGGAVAQLKRGPLSAVARLGGFYERAQGKRQQVAGLRSSLLAGTERGALRAGLGLSYERRQYQHGGRTDNRLTPMARAAYSIDETLAVIGTYALLNNTSNRPFDYLRHLGTVGIEMEW